MTENLRKKLSRLQQELDQMKRNTSSAMSLHESPSRTLEETTPLEGGDISSEGLDKLQKLIQRVEGNLIRRIAMVESTANKVHDM